MPKELQVYIVRLATFQHIRDRNNIGWDELHKELLLYCKLLEAGGYEHGDIHMERGRRLGHYRYIRVSLSLSLL